MKNNFTIYTTPISANGRKVLALAHHLQLSPEIKIINVYKGEGQHTDYLAINPFGKIPTLVEEDFILWESNAILQYIADKHGEYQLSSCDPTLRADISHWMFWESSHWQPTISIVLAGVVGHALVPHLIPASTTDPDWQNPTFLLHARFLNQHLGAHPFLVNDALTIADFSVAGMMTYFRFGKFPFENYPHITRWYEYIESLEAWKSTQATIWQS
jgi:glutathione S-transferase